MWGRIERTLLFDVWLMDINDSHCCCCASDMCLRTAFVDTVNIGLAKMYSASGLDYSANCAESTAVPLCKVRDFDFGCYGMLVRCNKGKGGKSRGYIGNSSCNTAVYKSELLLMVFGESNFCLDVARFDCCKYAANVLHKTLTGKMIENRLAKRWVLGNEVLLHGGKDSAVHPSMAA